MTLGIRGKLFLWTVLLVAAVDLAVGLYLGAQLRTSERGEIETRLLQHARSTRELLDVVGPAPRAEQVDPLADRVGEAVNARVTIIGADGVVVGDSELTVADIRAVENHANRPEVVAADRSGHGVAYRFSNTLQQDMLYVAIPWGPDAQQGVVRVAASIEQVDASLRQLRTVLLIAGLGAVALAAVVAAGAAQVISRGLRGVVATAASLAEGGQRSGQPPQRSDELGGLLGSVNKLATELERTVADLADERDRLSAVLQGMHEGLMAVNADHQVTLVNPSATELLELPEDTVGRPLLELVRIPALAELVSTAQGGQASSTEFETAASVPRRMLAHATPHGSNRGAIVVLHDVSEIRRLETVRRDFVANVSHELRTPVSIIRANAETLLDGGLDHPDQARRFLAAMLRSSDRLGRLVGDLLDISRIEAGQYTIERSKLALAPLVAQILESVGPQAAAKEISVSVEIPDQTTVAADGKALEQVLVNLVDNAVKYTPSGGHVWIRATPDEAAVRIEVADDGPDIGPAHRARVFERFFRVDPGRSRDMGGTGLGLSIVKHLADAMGGTVGVEPRSPQGSVFWVRLPNAPVT